MIAVDIAFVVIAIAGITAIASVVAASRARKIEGRHAQVQLGPAPAHTRAIRVLDQILTAEKTGSAVLPSDLASEAEALVAEFYHPKPTIQ